MAARTANAETVELGSEASESVAGLVLAAALEAVPSVQSSPCTPPRSATHDAAPRTHSSMMTAEQVLEKQSDADQFAQLEAMLGENGEQG